MENSKTLTRKRKAPAATTDPAKRLTNKPQPKAKRTKKDEVECSNEGPDNAPTTAAKKGRSKKVLQQDSGENSGASRLSKDSHIEGKVLDVWDEVDMLSHFEKIPHSLARQFIALLAEGCTLPFIARYRKNCVDHLTPDRLQELYESYQNVIQFKKKCESVLQNLTKSKKLTPELQMSILNAKSMSELELIYAPLKSHTLSLADRARNLGLEQCAVRALNGDFIDLAMMCDFTNEELATLDKVETHITHIVADIIYKDTRVLQYMRELKTETRFTIQSTRTKTAKEKNESEKKKIDPKSNPETYKIYFDWKCPVLFVKCHQTLAINRGENEKILSIKLNIPDWFYNKLERYCLTMWKSGYWVRKGLGDAYCRLIKPWLSRQVRSELTVTAQREAIKTFTANLEKYLLTEPVKNRRIAGLDPGFKAGCKVGIIDCNGEKLEAFTIHPDLRSQNQNDAAAKKLQLQLNKHG